MVAATMLMGPMASPWTSSALLRGASRRVLLITPLVSTALLQPACSRALSDAPLTPVLLEGAAGGALSHSPLASALLGGASQQRNGVQGAVQQPLVQWC